MDEVIQDVLDCVVLRLVSVSGRRFGKERYSTRFGDHVLRAGAAALQAYRAQNRTIWGAPELKRELQRAPICVP
jgi:hypothetical protein